jgi:CsoR family transcriptional regulator, copper-sensing transcriptional repressor
MSTNLVGYSASKQQLLSRLRRIEGQVRGVHRLVDEDTYCIDVLAQISAATSALGSVAIELVGEHLRHCLHDAMTEGGAAAEERIAEAQQAIARMVRS